MVDPHLLYRDIQLSSVPQSIYPPILVSNYWLVVVGDACHTQHSTASHSARCLFSTSSKQLSLSPVDLSSCGTLSDASNLFFFYQPVFGCAMLALQDKVDPALCSLVYSCTSAQRRSHIVCLLQLLREEKPSPGASVVGALGVS